MLCISSYIIGVLFKCEQLTCFDIKSNIFVVIKCTYSHTIYISKKLTLLHIGYPRSLLKLIVHIFICM